MRSLVFEQCTDLEMRPWSPKSKSQTPRCYLRLLPKNPVDLTNREIETIEVAKVIGFWSKKAAGGG
jgi:hypothetical protein